jgi:hypothetical protein
MIVPHVPAVPNVPGVLEAEEEHVTPDDLFRWLKQLEPLALMERSMSQTFTRCMSRVATPQQRRLEKSYPKAPDPPALT